MPTKILTVDDSKTIRMIIQRAFRAYDCAFCEAANGEEGLAAAAREKPDLIILDITMPVMDGVTMLSTLRQDSQLKSTPVIMLSAESSRDNVASISQLGISDYLVKPFKEDILLEKVRKIVPLTAKAA
jgi:two-component system, cell cycle response regulator